MAANLLTFRLFLGLALVSGTLFLGCGSSDDIADAYGNFEATEVLISAEASGTLTSFDVAEGQILAVGQVVGQIDTVQLSLGRARLLANRNALEARIRSVNAQVSVLKEERRIAEIDRKRVDQLFADKAATQKQVDDAHGRIGILDQRITSTRTQTASLRGEIAGVDAQIAQLDDQINKSSVVNPVAGTVLTSLAEPHELITFGKPLYRVADLTSMYLRAYLSGSQLSEVNIGQAVEVGIDDADGETLRLPGEITWISSEAEFTPKHVQTRDERINLVYGFKVRVANGDGRAKIGMPAEVYFAKTGSPAS